MVIRAAKRILDRRGVVALIDEPRPLGRAMGDESKED